MYSDSNTCPILTTSMKLSQRRRFECINCPLVQCWEDLPERGRLKLFYNEILKAATELEGIEVFVRSLLGK